MLFRLLCYLQSLGTALDRYQPQTMNRCTGGCQMKFSTIANSIVVVTVAALLVVLALRVRTAATADSVAVLKTGGMTCSSCSDKITKALSEMKGVATAEVDVAGGWVVVGYETKSVKPDALAAKVVDTGFGSNVYRVLTPEQFKQITGRDIGQKAIPSKGCCGNKDGGCSSNKPG